MISVFDWKESKKDLFIGFDLMLTTCPFWIISGDITDSMSWSKLNKLTAIEMKFGIQKEKLWKLGIFKALII